MGHPVHSWHAKKVIEQRSSAVQTSAMRRESRGEKGSLISINASRQSVSHPPDRSCSSTREGDTQTFDRRAVWTWLYTHGIRYGIDHFTSDFTPYTFCLGLRLLQVRSEIKWRGRESSNLSYGAQARVNSFYVYDSVNE